MRKCSKKQNSLFQWPASWTTSIEEMFPVPVIPTGQVEKRILSSSTVMQPNLQTSWAMRRCKALFWLHPSLEMAWHLCRVMAKTNSKLGLIIWADTKTHTNPGHVKSSLFSQNKWQPEGSRQSLHICAGKFLKWALYLWKAWTKCPTQCKALPPWCWAPSLFVKWCGGLLCPGTGIFG